MSLAADALQPMTVQALFGMSGRTPPCNLPDVITSGRGAGFDLEFDGATKAVGIDFREPIYIGETIGGDALRFAGAAFTSVFNIDAAVEERESVAWAMVRLYYAAFYAGHAVLRLLGQSCSHLETGHIARLKQLAAAIGAPPPFAISSGLYHCTMNAAQTGLKMVRARGSVGGTHETFWEVFDAFLASTTEAVLLGHLAPADARAVFLKLESYRSILRLFGGGAAWLSRMRNDIQYRQDHGVWMPPSVNKSSRDQLARLAMQWSRDPMAVDIEILGAASLKHFVAGCVFPIALCRALLTRISERSSAAAPKFGAAALALC